MDLERGENWKINIFPCVEALLLNHWLHRPWSSSCQRISAYFTWFSIDIFCFQVSCLNKAEGQNGVWWMITQRTQQLAALILRWWLESLPKWRFPGKVHLTQRQKHLADRIIARKTIVIKHVKVQYPRLELLDWETLKIECFVPARIKCTTFDFRLQAVLLIRQKGYADIWIWRAAEIFRRQLFSLKQTKRKF